MWEMCLSALYEQFKLSPIIKKINFSFFKSFIPEGTVIALPVNGFS